MRNRKFGVEIECGHPGGYSHVESLLRSALPQWFDRRVYPKIATVGVDGSGVEARTPPLRGKKGFAELQLALATIRDSGGYTSDTADGLHVHHNAPEFLQNPRLVLRAARWWDANEALIESFVGAHRVGRGSCVKLSALHNTSRLIPADNYNGRTELVDVFKEKEKIGRRLNPTLRDLAGGWGRGALNFQSLLVHGTVEIRLHEGTLDFETAEAWIHFGQCFLDRVVRSRRTIKCPDPSALLQRLEVEEFAAERLLARTPQQRLVAV